MKYPSTLHGCILFFVLLNLGQFINTPLLAQSNSTKVESATLQDSENSRAAPSIIFKIENTLTPPSEFFEYLDMNFPSSITLEQVEPGLFHIYNLAPNRSYVLDFKGKGPMLLGVTTQDISIILRHILGLGSLMPDRIIAADATGDGRVSAADLVDIRKVLLGKSDSFGVNASWRFLPATAEFIFSGTTIDLGTIKAIKVGHVN